MRIALLLFPLMWPALATADEVNPFQPGGVARPEVSVFSPPPRQEPAPQLIPPPLPPPPNWITGALEPSGETAASAPPALFTPPPACTIEVTPSAPLVGAQGGSFTLTIETEPESSDGCVAGIESRGSWLEIRYFDGKSLTLEAKPNPEASARRGEVVLASMHGSLTVNVVQAPR